MKYTHILILFLITSSVPLLHDFASAEECKNICIAKPFYSEGEAVVISGKVEAFLPNTPLLLQVFREANRVHIAQVEVAQDGTFTYSLIADGPYFQKDGKYTVQASYGVTRNVFEAGFDFQTATSGTNPTQIFEVKAGDGGTFDVPYTINGGTIKDIIVDPSILGLIVTIQADDDGSLTLDLGRQWVDARLGADGKSGGDDFYIIYIDGLEVPYQESSVKSESRLITIQFQEGNSDIEIIGTYVVPEFGPIAIAILIISITFVMMLSRKKLNLESKIHTLP